MSKEEFDWDKEIERLARKTNVNVKKSEYSFENRISKLDKDIDRILNKKIKEFDENKQVALDHLTTDYRPDTIGRYREKLKKI